MRWLHDRAIGSEARGRRRVCEGSNCRPPQIVAVSVFSNDDVGTLIQR